MLESIPRLVWIVFWVLVAVLLVILAAWAVHLLGGGMVNVRFGHFVFRTGVN